MARKAKPKSWMSFRDLVTNDCFQMFRDHKYPEEGTRDAVFRKISAGEVRNPGNIIMAVDQKDRGIRVKRVSCTYARAAARKKMEMRIRHRY